MNRVVERGRRLLSHRRIGRFVSMGVSMAIAASGMAFAVGAKTFVEPDHRGEEPPEHIEGIPSPEPTQSKPPVKPIPTKTPEQKPPPPVVKPSSKPTPEPSKTIACRNSTDPACGEFFWDPKPGSNAPMTVTVTWSKDYPAPGDEVVFTVVAEDPDAWIDAANVKIFFGDGTYRYGAAGGGGCTGRYGPWTPPDRKPGRVQLTFTHTYAEAGDYVIKAYAKSAPGCYQPYQSYGDVQQTLRVTAPEPSPS